MNLQKWLGFFHLSSIILLVVAQKSVIGAPPLKKENTAGSIFVIVIPVLAIVVIILFLLLLLSLCVCIILKKRQKRNPENNAYVVDESSSVESLQYNFGTIETATNNFSDSNKLGQGGFGPVYKGELPNGEEVAVKRLCNNNNNNGRKGQGDVEFKNEVILLSMLLHRNLVRLLGFCLLEGERLIVYEFVPNASLDHFLFDPVKREILDWKTRYNIIDGISRGLVYLHEGSRVCIIHRDLKAGNVLLDAEMKPKIADFGTARLFESDESHASTSKIVGTFGYMAPEYVMHGQFSVKSDVFSFGVLVLEIVSGQKNRCHFGNGESVQHLMCYAWTQWREGTAMNLVDPILLRGNSAGSVPEMMRCIHIALLCVQENVGDRPTMSTVDLMLTTSSSSLSLPPPSAPGFFSPELSQLQQLLTHYSSHNQASFSELYPR